MSAPDSPTPDKNSSIEEAQHLRELAEMVLQSTDMISRHTPNDWRFIYASPAVTPILGFSPDEIVGMPAADMYHPDDVGDFENRASSVRYDRGVYTHTYRFRCKDGNYTWLESTSRSIRNESGELLEILVVSRNVTARKAAEEQAQRYQAKINHASRLIAMGEMASGLAHELNQPLTAIANYVQGMTRILETKSPSAEELKTPLENIARTALRSGEIIHRMRNFARKGETNREQIDIQELVRDVISFCEPQAKQRQVELTRNIPNKLPRVYGDRIQIEQVLLNLILNAIEATEPQQKNRVRVEACLDKLNMVRISVKDQGSGIPTDDTELLFEQFYSTKNQGLGMGLSISRSLIEAHGGQLWAENQNGNQHQNNGKGAVFHFTLESIDPTPQRATDD